MPQYLRTTRNLPRRGRRKGLGDTQCFITAGGARLCYDSSMFAPAPAAAPASEADAENANMIAPRGAAPSRAASYAAIDAATAANAAAAIAAAQPSIYTIPFDPQSQLPVGTITTTPAGVVTVNAATATPATTALAAPTGNTLFDTISSYLPAAITGQSLVTGYPDWLFLLGGGVGIYLFLGRRGRR